MKKITLLFVLVSLEVLGQNAANNGLQQFTMELWSQNEWKTSSRRVFTEDANGYLIQEDHDGWSESSNSYYPFRKFEATVNGNGNFIQKIGYSAENGGWIEIDHSNYSYDSEGKLASLAFENINGFGEWVNGWMIAYGYDSSGFLTTETYHNWSEGAYWTSYRFFITNNAEGKKISRMRQFYDGEGWIDNNITTYTYNSSGLLILEEAENPAENWWYETVEYSYGSDNRVSQSIHKSVVNGEISYMARRTYSYAPLGVEENGVSDLKIYPNPVVDKLQISGNAGIKSISVSGVDGKIFDLAHDGDFIDLSKLPTGVYILRAETERRSLVKKFVKE